MERFKRAWEENVQQNLIPWILFVIVSYFVTVFSLYIGLFPIIAEVRAAGRERRAPEIGNLFDFSKWGQYIPHWLALMGLNVLMLIVFMVIGGGSAVLFQVHEVVGMICSFLGLLLMIVVSLAINLGAFMAPWVMTSGKFSPLDALKVSFSFGLSNIGAILIHGLVAMLIVFVSELLCFLPILVAIPVVLLATSYFYDEFESNILDLAQQKQIPIKS